MRNVRTMIGAGFLVGFVTVLTIGLFARFRPAAATEAPVSAPVKRGLAFVAHDLGLPESGHWITTPVLADLDRDGIPDLIASERRGTHAWRGENGRFVPFQPPLPSTGPGIARIGDVDGDARPDVVVVSSEALLTLRLAPAGHRWLTATRVAPSRDVSDATLTDVGTAMELVIASRGADPLRRLIGSPAGWTPTAPLIPHRGGGPRVITADIDGDGREDVVALHGGVRVLLQRDNGTFVEQSVGLPGAEGLDDLTDVAVADIDGDRRADIIVTAIGREGRNGLAIYRQARHGTWRGDRFARPMPETHWAIAVLDADGDGRVDIAAATADRIDIYLHGRLARAPRASIAMGPMGDPRLTVGDLDHDGRDDILVAHRAGIVTLLNRSTPSARP